MVTNHYRNYVFQCCALIRYNKLNELPVEIVLCVLLEELSLENNAIVSLPCDLYGCLVKLSSVQLSRNKFETFPIVQPEHLAHMNSLNIEHNHITKIPHGILSKVDISYLIFHTTYFIPLQAPAVTSFIISHNLLTTLPLDFGTWTGLRELDLSSNQLQVLPG